MCVSGAACTGLSVSSDNRESSSWVVKYMQSIFAMMDANTQAMVCNFLRLVVADYTSSGLQCFQLFSEVLAIKQPAAAADALDAEAAAAQEWHKFTLACLRAFTRRYHAAVAPLSQALESGVFAADKGDPDVRQAFLQSLHI